MSKPTAVLFCPGRGSYGRDELGSLGRSLRPGEVREALSAADARRSEAGQPGILELDAADSFRPSLHLDGRNASELLFFASVAEIELLRERYRILAVAGNSLGWYTALTAAGSLSVAAGAHLVATMANLQALATGGQLLTTILDPDWRVDPELETAIETAIENCNAKGPDHFVATSIRLGGHRVLAGTEPGIRELLTTLPKIERGQRKFPFQLAGHGPFHTALCAQVAAKAQKELRELPFRRPNLHLIDGLGNQHSPWSTDPYELYRYTTDQQVTETFDFSAAVRTALREFNPEFLLCAGPGTSLRAPVGHILLAEGYHSIGTKTALQASELVRCE